LPAPSPDAAAQLWLDQIPLADRLAAAAHTDIRLWGWLAAGLVTIAVSVAVARGGLIGRLRLAIERNGPNPWLVRTAGVGAFALTVLAARALTDAIAGQPPVQAASGVLPGVGLAIIVLTPLQWLIRSRPRTWPWIAGTAAGVAILAATWLPYALSLGAATRPLPNGPVRAGLETMSRQAGLSSPFLGLSDDPAFVADVSGGLGPTHVTIGPRLLAGPPDQARALVGHVAGHFAHADILILSLIYAGMTAGALAALAAVYRPLARTMGVAEALGEPEGLPVATVVAVAAIALSTLGGGAYLRWANMRADAYALDRSRAPDGLARGLLSEWDHASVDPSPVEEALFYTHPPLRRRLVRIAEWQAARSG